MMDQGNCRVPWKGVFTALITPFKQDGSLDRKGLAALVQRQIKAGIHGLVPCGTTGENPVLTFEEWSDVIEITVRETAGRAWIVAGTGTNNTLDSMKRTRTARELGADGALVITPYYNKPTVEGMLNHFSRVAEAGEGLPIMVYNVPGRTNINLSPDAYARFTEIPSVCALKEASGDLGQVWEDTHRFGKLTPVFSGEDAQNFPIWEVGGAGAVSVLSNVIPEMVVEQYNAFASGDLERACELHWKFLPLSGSLFVETSPTPAKYALSQMGLPAGPVREPLIGLRESSKELIRKDLAALGCIQG